MAELVNDNDVVTSTQVIWCDFGGVLTDPGADLLDRVSTMCAVPVDALLTALSSVVAEFGGDGIFPLETGRLAEAEWGARVAARLAPTWQPRTDLRRFRELW
jgi:putative hydrolase of the HAD superfamily